MALPAPTALAATSEYFVAGTRAYSFVSTIANKAAPSSAELTAGTALEGDIQAVSGFNVTVNQVEVPNAKDLYTGKIPGRQTSDDSTITFYLDSTSSDVRTLFTDSLNGFIVIYPEGIHTGCKMDVFPVRVASVSKAQDIEASGMVTVTFSITSKPQLDLAIPTA